MERVGDAFVWPLRDPEWLPKILVIGLILLIPVIGGINGLGWMLASLDRLRAGDRRLPPANFDHLGRGAGLFVVFLAYYLVLAVLALVFYVPAILVLSGEGRGSPNPLLIVLGLALLGITVGVVTVGALALTFVTPAIVLAVDRGGIAGGFELGSIVRRARASLINTLIAGLMLIAAGLIGQLGAVLCVIGVVFTSAYALAMQAWIIRSYEED